jgi:DNA-directed RNA polymerase subunit RPC12/RpoP
MKVKCPKCGNVMDVTSLERPLRVKCPVCNTEGMLKAKPQQPQYVPPVSSTPYSPYAPPPSHVPYPAQHPPYPSPPAWYPEKKKTNISLAAGVLLIIAGILAMGTWGFIMIGAGEIATLYGETGLSSFLIICGAIGFVLSVFPLLGGIMAVKKTHWGIALAGSIIGLFTIGPLIAISSILSLIALILIAVSKEEFRQPVR